MVAPEDEGIDGDDDEEEKEEEAEATEREEPGPSDRELLAPLRGRPVCNRPVDGRGVLLLVLGRPLV